jgi:hypothetical protein
LHIKFNNLKTLEKYNFQKKKFNLRQSAFSPPNAPKDYNKMNRSSATIFPNLPIQAFLFFTSTWLLEPAIYLSI